MKVVLAGYNIDSQVISEAAAAGISRDRLSPEVLSAAYARISRDPRPVGELRRVALEEVEKARASNRKIIFGMGHHSVAEHAVFNFDITGVSRLAIEEIERFRLCSFTEKSQRYITLDHNFVVPEEIRGTGLEAELCSLVKTQSSLYERINGALREHLGREHPEHEGRRSGRRLLDGWAKEDARYVTLLATTGQLGLTANARNLELIVRRFAASDLAEVRDLGLRLYEAVVEVSPSLMLFTEPSPFDRETGSDLGRTDLVARAGAGGGPEQPAVRLVSHTPDADRAVAAALLFAVTRRPFAECSEAVERASDEELVGLFDAAMGRMEFHDAPWREFEHVSFTYEVSVSASCFAQLKRHRMTTQSVQRYDPGLGITVPPSIVHTGHEGELREHAARAERLHEKMVGDLPAAAEYALTNAHRRRVLLTINLRDLYHFVRLREDLHAQWDIRGLAAGIRAAAEEVAPLGALLLCGKDGFVERFERAFGRRPDLDPGALDPPA